jgi:crotonobetainyl-CoA:carnitine CoA-transferase CaiB-like acyl-CoA transferase
MMTAPPLEGLTVVAFEQAVAAPFATRHLADLGARVIKIERDSGDFARAYDASVNGISSYFAWLNRSKESVVLDLKTPAGIDAATLLATRADVVVQNLGPGAMDRLGLGPDVLRSRNPRLIYASISGYGTGGPYDGKKAYDLLIQCETGLLSVTGSPAAPAKVGVSIADIAAGMYAYTAVLSALLQLARTGEGQTVDVSLLDALSEWMMQPALYAAYSGHPPARTGAAHATIAPYGPVDCSDGTIYLAIQNEREWRRFCERVLEVPALADDPRFTSNTLRVRHRAALDEIVLSLVSSWSRETLARRLDEAAIANAQLRDLHGLWSHPQLSARDRWREVDGPTGPIRVALPPVIAGWATRLGPIPALGADTDQVLAEMARQQSSGDGS